VVETARILGVTTDAVRSRLRRGTIKGHKIDGEWVVRLLASRVLRLALILSDLRSEFVKFGAVIVDVAFK